MAANVAKSTRESQTGSGGKYVPVSLRMMAPTNGFLGIPERVTIPSRHSPK
jgi:hypothetical protein